jgi:N-sulfoglucosamine sulfohydrolase
LPAPEAARTLAAMRVLLLLGLWLCLDLRADRPNVLWIVSDDLGPDVGCYGTRHVATPNVDRLAREGRCYLNAFASAPVCSPSRSAFITGMYQTTIAAHHHRTHLMKPLPEGCRPVTAPFRDAGYFVCNMPAPDDKRKKAKEDYNFLHDGNLYDGDDWGNRRPGQPFFAQVQIFEPHRTFVANTDPERPAQVDLSPLYPDHPVTRADHANYLASVEEMDRKVGLVLQRLEDEGLTDSTIVILFGDHGRPHVWGKQWLYDAGLRTPLIIRWPGRIKPGSVDAGMVSLIDIAPTSLAAVGLPVPAKMQGVDILAEDFTGRDAIYAARDRCGDAPDRIRAVRTERFKYIRNFHPELPYTQLSSYKKLQYPVLTLLQVIHRQGRLSPEQDRLLQPTRPAEELYDLQADPYEMRNLAAEPGFAKELAHHRNLLEKWITDTDDQGRFPEGDAE